VLSVVEQSEGLSAAPPSPGSWRRSLHRGAAILGRLMPRFSHAQQACQVCQCSQWWHSGKDCPPLPSPVRVQGAGNATLPSSTATDHATGISPSPGSWRRSLHRGAAIVGRLMPRFSHAQQACQVCQCSQWWHSGKDCPPLPSPVRVQGAGNATLPSSTATDHATGISPSPGSWRRSLYRGAAILGRLMPRSIGPTVHSGSTLAPSSTRLTSSRVTD